MALVKPTSTGLSVEVCQYAQGLNMKICITCKEPNKEFYSDKNYEDGLMSVCKECHIDNGNSYRHSLVGLLKRSYSNQKACSKKRCHPKPSYTFEEFMIWAIRQDNFIELFNNWKLSGFTTELRPSCDRLDDYKGYSFDNIQLITWAENEAKLHRDIKSGKNRKKSKVCEQFTLDGVFIAEWVSLKEAARNNVATSAGISQCCKGLTKQSGGYIWKYKGEE